MCFLPLAVAPPSAPAAVVDLGDDAADDPHDGAQRVRGRAGVGPETSVRRERKPALWSGRWENVFRREQSAVLMLPTLSGGIDSGCEA